MPSSFIVLTLTHAQCMWLGTTTYYAICPMQWTKQYLSLNSFAA